MSLTIDNDQTCQLANELAQLTGEPVVEAISVAIKERLARRREIHERLQRIRAISERSAKLFEESGPPPEHGEFLYDEQGLPK